MKKLVLVLAFIFLVLLICIYLLIPGTINISKVSVFPSTENGTERLLADQDSWAKWWPSKITGNQNKQYELNGYSFSSSRRIGDDIEIIISGNSDTVASIVNIIPIGKDSAGFTWKCKLSSSLNPFSRISSYFKAAAIKEDMDNITASLLHFCSDKLNIYGLKISTGTMVDTLLITYKAGESRYPTTEHIYDYITQLRNYALSQGARQTNPPLVHLEQMDSSLYGIMVAIPVDREIKDNGNFVFKHMPHTKILVSPDIKGGTNEVSKAYQAITNYMNDYQRISPGISFMSLKTDRISEPDSSKWITKIFYPVL